MEAYCTLDYVTVFTKLISEYKNLGFHITPNSIRTEQMNKRDLKENIDIFFAKDDAVEEEKEVEESKEKIAENLKKG